jgi:hypothetical protein
MEKLGSSKIVKIGIVVRDIEEVAKRYGELFHVEPPVVHYPDPAGSPPKTPTNGSGAKITMFCSNIPTSIWNRSILRFWNL